MDAKSRIPARFAMMAAAASASLLMVVGCASTRMALSRDRPLVASAGIAARSWNPSVACSKSRSSARPFGDPAINEVVWKAADEQIIPQKERRAWEVNGLRVGRIDRRASARARGDHE